MKTDSPYKYYRSILSESEKKNYDIILTGLLQLGDRIPIKVAPIQRIEVIYQYIKMDNPLLFYVDSVKYLQVPLGLINAILPSYRFPKSKIEITTQQLLDKAFAIINGTNTKAPTETEKAIHDYLCTSVSYDTKYAASSYECVGPLLFNKGVCEGISKAVKLLCDLSHIKCLVIHGEAITSQLPGMREDELHTWNIIYTGKNYVHLDVTFDISVQMSTAIRYDYFNLSDTEIQQDHRFLAAPVPSCPVSEGFYILNGMYMHTQDDLKRYIVRCRKEGLQDIIFKLPASANMDTAPQRILQCVSQISLSHSFFLQQYRLAYNNSQKVFQLHIK